MLIVFGGLPGTGKTTLARKLAEKLGATYLRIDTIDRAILESAITPAPVDLADSSYRAGYALAEDNLRLGRLVIADSVNDWEMTRAAWRAIGERAGVETIEIEITCTDRAEHRRRVETRTSDIAGLKLPSWAEIEAREYHEWHGPHIVIDTAGKSAERSFDDLVAAIDRT